MKKYPKCNRRLKENAVFCPACGAKVKKNKKIRFLIAILAALFIIAIGWFGGILLARFYTGDSSNTLSTLEDDHIEIIHEDLEVLTDGDISEITERVFGSAGVEGPVSESEDGIVADLFANAEIEIVSSDDSSINYKILAPDISDFFTVCANQIDTITTSEELGQAILEYAQTAPVKEYSVSIPYTISGDSINVEYNDPDFINAMTGGLLDAYMVLYEQYLTEG